MPFVSTELNTEGGHVNETKLQFKFGGEPLKLKKIIIKKFSDAVG